MRKRGVKMREIIDRERNDKEEETAKRDKNEN